MDYLAGNVQLVIAIFEIILIKKYHIKKAYSFYKQYAFFFVLSCNSYELDL